jgi:hypothetical protein
MACGLGPQTDDEDSNGERLSLPLASLRTAQEFAKIQDLDEDLVLSGLSFRDLEIKMTMVSASRVELRSAGWAAIVALEILGNS